MRVVGSNTTTSSIYGAAVGADYWLSPDTLAGFALAGGGTNFSVAGWRLGRSDLFQAGAFIRHNVGAAYLTGALAYGWQDVTTDRTVTVAGIDRLRARIQRQCVRRAASKAAIASWRHGSAASASRLMPPAQFTAFELPAYAERRRRRQHLCADLRRQERHSDAQRVRPAHRQVLRDARCAS